MQDMPRRDEFVDALRSIRMAYERLEASNARLLEALQFYADPYEFQLALGREPTGKKRMQFRQSRSGSHSR